MMQPRYRHRPTLTVWFAVLVALLAAQQFVLGVIVGGVSGGVGIGGALLIGIAIGIHRRARLMAGALLIAGALPFALMLWWSVIAPVLGLVTLLLGAALLAQAPGPARATSAASAVGRADRRPQRTGA